MVIFGVKTEDNELIDFYVKMINYKLKSNNFIKNPFRGKIKKYKNKNKSLYVISMKPIYFNFSIFGFISFIILYSLFGFSLWLLPSLIVSSLHFFYTKYFYYYMFKIGLKKIKYKGKIQLLSADECLEVII